MAEQFIATVNKVGDIVSDGKVIGKAVDQASSTASAIAQTTDAAAVVDSIAKHLGEAAGNLGAKFSEVVSTYGPNAAALIHEVGRVKAMSDVGGFLLAFALFGAAVIVLFRSWRQMETSTTDDTNNDLQGMILFRVVASAIISIVGFVAVLINFSLASLYGIFSPEAYLVIKLLKW